MTARDDLHYRITRHCSDDLATQLLAAYRAENRIEAFHEAADEVDVDDCCDCGGCDSCVMKAAAVRLREKAGQPAAPLIVTRFDTAMEPAPEEEPVLTIGAVAETGRPVALLLDEETRRKVAGWLAPTNAGEKSSREADATPQPDDALTLECSSITCRRRAPLSEARQTWSRPAGEYGWLCADCAADFFQPGHTYRHSAWSFRCDAVTTHPDTGERTALGWFRFRQQRWRPFTAGAGHWRDRWRDITEPARASEPPSCATNNTLGEGT
ncbi:hypothetical protein [Streptomyces sp. NPDC045251]|uniref:hypothetical protein n=1 Tax=unclassified Streptomyces TaxID=2593676 RepID=UPI0033FB9B20